MIYVNREDAMLEIKNSVIEKISKYKQIDIKDREAGGILIGRKMLDSNNYIIDICTEPQKYDKRERYSFLRSKKIHQEILDELWEESGATKSYLGEWHTHPENDPTPSSKDLIEWKKLLFNQTKEVEFLFFIIVGIKNIRVYRGVTFSGEIKSLERLKVDYEN